MTSMNQFLDGAGRPSRRRRTSRKKKRTTRRVLLFFLALFLVAVGIVVWYLWSLSSAFDSKSEKIQNAFPTEVSRPAEIQGKGLNILLMGSDSRAASDGQDATVSDNARSDTLILVHIPQDRSAVYFTSIMRDTWVEIPGRGPAKINAAAAFGGSALTVQTVESLTGARIDNVMRIQFEGFKSLVDALGGVTVNVPVAYQGTTIDRSFAAGPQNMDGETALAFVRERYAFADGDYQRVRNQQAFLKGVFAKIASRDVLLDPAKISTMVTEFAPFVAVDQTLNAGSIASLGVSLRNVGADKMNFATLPNLGTGTSADGQSIVLPDDNAIQAFGKALREDNVGAFFAGLRKP